MDQKWMFAEGKGLKKRKKSGTFHFLVWLLLDKQIFASSDARFGRDTCICGHNMPNVGHDMVSSP